MRVFIFLSLLFTSLLTFAHPHQQTEVDERICAPFRSGVVDQAIVKVFTSILEVRYWPFPPIQYIMRYHS
jgi:hypothetical protein